MSRKRLSFLEKDKEEFNLEEYASEEFLKKIRRFKEGMRKARKTKEKKDYFGSGT